MTCAATPYQVSVIWPNPTEDGDPDHYSERQVGGDDNGGVHTNSGIPNHAYYLLVNGGSNAGEALGHAHSGPVVTGIDLVDAERIFFLGMTGLSSNATMADARSATEAVATALFGGASQQLQSTTDAWLAVGVGSPAPSDDAPTVAVTSPADGATISGVIDVTADATDDDGVTQVEFFADGISLGVDDTAPYVVMWDTNSAGDGLHTVMATATDTIGQSTSDNVDAFVNNVDDPPEITVTSPANGAVISGTSVAFTADASDDGAVSQVEFFVDGVSIGVDTAAPYSAWWDSTTAADGPHTLRATATDDALQTSSHSISVTVDNSAPADTVTITKAQYRARKDLLQVRAASTDAGAVLTAFDAVTNFELGVLVNGELKRSMGAVPIPSSVRVESSGGSSDTKAVQVK